MSESRPRSCPTRPFFYVLALALTILSIAAAGVRAPFALAASTLFDYRMGTETYPVTDSTGLAWAPRSGFDSGRMSVPYPLIPIAGTADPMLYRGHMVGMNGWSMAVPDSGAYDVTLKMRETYWQAPGKRVFSVAAEGAPALTDIDVYAAVGFARAYDKTVRVTVTDGRLNLTFSAARDLPMVSAIRVVKAPASPGPTQTTTPGSTPSTATAPTVVRVTASDTDYTDSQGRVWKARNGFVGGSAWGAPYGTGRQVTGTVDKDLYAVELVGMSSWSTPIANGTYTIRTKAREAYWESAGKRVFSITAEGRPGVSNVDIFAAVGRDAAYDSVFTVPVSDGVLNLNFTASVDLPLLTALEVVPAGATTTSPPTTTTTSPSTAGSWQAGAFLGSVTWDGAAASRWSALRGAPTDAAVTFLDSASPAALASSVPRIGTYSGFPGRLVLGVPLATDDKTLTLAGTARGDADQIWRNLAATLTSANRGNSVLRLGFEANGEWYPWGPTGGSNADYIAAFRRAAAVLKGAAPGLTLEYDILCGQPLPGQTGRLDALSARYPGDDVVDLVGCTLYDVGATRAGSDTEWAASLAPAAAPGLSDLLKFATNHTKRAALPEWGLVDTTEGGGGDNALFVQKVREFLAANASAFVLDCLSLDANPSSLSTNGGPFPNSLARYGQLW